MARHFEPQVTRVGGSAAKYRSTARCSGCHKSDTYETSRATGDDVVKGYFKDRGWLLGRNRSYDLCPACLAALRNPEPSRHSTEARREGSGAPKKQLDHWAAPTNRRHQDTADILARHLGRPEAVAAEVFRPKEVQPPHLSALEPQNRPSQAPTLPSKVEQAFAEMATDLKGLRSAVELLTEQVSKLAALGNQQIEAIARLAPLMVQSAEGISGGLRDVVSAVRSMSSSPPPASEAIQPAAEAMRVEEQLARQLELLQELDPAIGSEAEPAPRMVKARRKSNQNPPAKKIEGSAPKAASAPVVVKSIPDAKRSDRFYTTVRLPREVWDSAGFGSDDRLLIDWTGKVLTISRATEGGIKPKTIGATAVVLQSWKLGNLNIDQPRVSCEDTSLRLTVRR